MREFIGHLMSGAANMRARAYRVHSSIIHCSNKYCWKFSLLFQWWIKFTLYRAAHTSFAHLLLSYLEPRDSTFFPSACVFVNFFLSNLLKIKAKSKKCSSYLFLFDWEIKWAHYIHMTEKAQRERKKETENLTNQTTISSQCYEMIQYSFALSIVQCLWYCPSFIFIFIDNCFMLNVHSP